LIFQYEGGPLKTNRLLRVGEEIKKELSKIINFEISEYSRRFLTVTEVRVTKDLQYAEVWVSVMGDLQQQTATVSRLQSDVKRLRKALAGRVYLRQLPELRFNLDQTLEYANRIDHLLRESGIDVSTEAANERPN
jgi:ribosome-binding factor A